MKKFFYISLAALIFIINFCFSADYTKVYASDYHKGHEKNNNFEARNCETEECCFEHENAKTSSYLLTQKESHENTKFKFFSFYSNINLPANSLLIFQPIRGYPTENKEESLVGHVIKKE